MEKGAYVIALDNLSYGKKENIPPLCNETIIGDILDRALLDKIRDVSCVFHLASPSSVILFNRDPITCTHITMCGLVNTLEWARDTGVERLVYLSSGSVYGNVGSHRPEVARFRPINLYGISKLACEDVIRKYSEDVPSVVLRVFAGYGPGEDHKDDFASVVTLFLSAMTRDKAPIVYGDGNQRRDFVYIDDVVEATIRCVERNVTNKPMDVGSGKAYTFNQVVSLINSILGKSIKPSYVSKPKDYLESTLADTTALRELLDITPLDLKEGLTKYLTHVGLVR